MKGLARPLVLGAAAWVVVVLVGSVLVWTVISRAGADIGSDAMSAPSGRSGGDATSSGRDAGAGRDRPARRTPAPTTAPTPSPPSDPAGPSDPAAPTPTPTPPAPSPSPIPEEAAQQRTWSGPAGVVTARCTGESISLVGANPSADGYAAAVDDRGPGRIEVEFEARGEDGGSDTKVRAECVDSVPVFEVSTDG